MKIFCGTFLRISSILVAMDSTMEELSFEQNEIVDIQNNTPSDNSSFILLYYLISRLRKSAAPVRGNLFFENGLNCPSVILITGNMRSDGSWFQILLQDHALNMSIERTKIMLDLTFDADKNVISQIGFENWTILEMESEYPITPGYPYTIEIHCDSKENPKYRIFINNDLQIDYTSQIAMSDIRYLYVVGDITVFTMLAINDGFFEYFPLTDGLKIGSVIRIKGTLDKNSDFLRIDLQDVDDRYDNISAIPLQIDVTQSEKRIKRNFFDGSWGENPKSSGGFPFKLGDKYEIEIYTEEDQYRIFIDGKHLSNSEHSLPINSVKVIKAGTTSTNAIPSIEYGLFETPIYYELPGFEKNRSTIVINGKINPDAKSFTISLQDSDRGEKTNIISLRIDLSADGFTLKQLNSSYSLEETTSTSTIFSTDEYKIKIQIKTDEYYINFNGEYLKVFPQTFPCRANRFLQISQGTTVKNIDYWQHFEKEDYVYLPEGIKVGSLVKVKGKMNSDGDNFNLNLCNEKLSKIHEFVPFDFLYKISSSTCHFRYYDQKWYELKNLSNCIGNEKKEFLIEVFIKENLFVCFINGKYSIEVPQKLEILNIRFIHIDGAAKITNVDYIENVEIPDYS